LDVYCVGYDTAAKILVAAGDNPERLRSEAAWAHMCGVAPIEASSGKTQRHRLNRGGNRQANSAIYHIMLTTPQLRPTHPRLPRTTLQRGQNHR
jgi:transposase